MRTKIYIFKYKYNGDVYNKPYAGITLEDAMNKFKKDRRKRKENYSLLNISVYHTGKEII